MAGVWNAELAPTVADLVQRLNVMEREDTVYTAIHPVVTQHGFVIVHRVEQAEPPRSPFVGEDAPSPH